MQEMEEHCRLLSTQKQNVRWQTRRIKVSLYYHNHHFYLYTHILVFFLTFKARCRNSRSLLFKKNITCHLLQREKYFRECLFCFFTFNSWQFTLYYIHSLFYHLLSFQVRLVCLQNQPVLTVPYTKNKIHVHFYKPNKSLLPCLQCSLWVVCTCKNNLSWNLTSAVDIAFYSEAKHYSKIFRKHLNALENVQITINQKYIFSRCFWINKTKWIGLK